MSEQVIVAQLGVTVKVSIEPTGAAVLSLLPSGGAVWLNPAQRLALARALAPEAFACIDESGMTSDERVRCFRAAMAIDQATPEGDGNE